MNGRECAEALGIPSTAAYTLIRNGYIKAEKDRGKFIIAECKLHDNCYTEDVFKFAKLNDDKRFCGVGERKGGDE